MPVSNDQIRDTVDRYLALVANGRGDEIAALYAEDATLEDPVGSDVLHGRDQIAAFYRTIEDLAMTTTLFTVRPAAGAVAFHFEVTTDLGSGSSASTAPIDVMTFDDDGLITSMKAYWSDADLVLR